MTPPKIARSDVQVLLNSQLGLHAHKIVPLRPGAWSAAYAFTSGKDEFVVRFSAYADDFARDAFAARFASDNLPIPRVTHRDRYNGLHYAVSERVRGRFLDELDGPSFERVLPSLLRTLNAMRTADVSDTFGYGSWNADGNGMYASWPDCLRKTLQDNPNFRGGSWRAKLESSPTGAVAFDRDLLVIERRIQNLPNLRNVLHIDLINFNAFVLDDRVSGVIDWGCAMYGDFLYELAWFQFWSPWYPQWSDVNLVERVYALYEDVGADLGDFRERLLCYQIHIGLTHQIYNASIGGWDDLAKVTRLTTVLADEVR